MSDEKDKSLHFTTGLLLGTAVAAGATFLYKTKKGQLARKIFQHHLKGIVDDIKTKSQQIIPDDPEIKIIKKQLTKKIKSAATVAKHVFFKSGKPLVK